MFLLDENYDYAKERVQAFRDEAQRDRLIKQLNRGRRRTFRSILNRFLISRLYLRKV